ncbi:MAG: TolC family protein [Fibrobacteria bacterium]
MSKSMEYPEKPLSKAANLYFFVPMSKRTSSRVPSYVSVPWFTLICILAPCGVAYAQSATLELPEAIHLAVENNFALSLSQDRSDQASVSRAGGVGAFLPSANASVNHSGTFRDTAGQTTMGASANWLVFNGFQDYNGYRRLQAQERSARLEERQSLESLLETVVVSYYDIVQLKQKLNAIGHLLAVSQERATLSQAKLEVGAGSKLDQLQSLADLNEDSSTYLNQGSALAQAKVRLNQVLARDPALDFDVADSIPLDAAPPLDDWRKGVRENNSAIAAARVEKSAAASGLAAARGKWLPSVTTGLSFGTTPGRFQDEGFKNPDDWRYNVNLSVPLFDRLGTPTAVRSARLDVRSRETGLRQVESAAASDFEQARKQYETAMRRISLEGRNLQVARLQAEAAQERYKLGASSPLEFRDAQTRLLDAEGRLISARQSAKQSEAALQRLAGYLIRQAPGGSDGTRSAGSAAGARGSSSADSAGGK